MQIKGPQSPAAGTAHSATLSAVSAASMVQGWRRGQTLQATVRQGSPTGPALLEINGKLLQAQTQQALQAGQRLQLAVKQPGTDAELKLLSAGPHSDGPDKNIRLPPPATRANWRTGQILQALIVQHPPDAPGKAVGKPSLVQIAGSILPLTLPAQTARETPAGQSLRLEIINPGQLATLQVLNVSTPVISPETAIRNTLPRQLPLTEVLANLQALSNATRQREGGLPPDVLQQIQRLLAQLPQHNAVSQAEGLQQALARSGIFLEAQLSEALRAQQPFAQTARQISGDLKGGLLGLLTILLGLRTPANMGDKSAQNVPDNGQNKPANAPPPLPNNQPFAQPRMPINAASLLNLSQHDLPQLLQALLRQVEGGLARIQLSQLASGSAEDDGKRSWLLDLPLRHGDQIDVLQIRIEEEHRRRNKHTETLWSVALAFELEGLGAIHARVSLSGDAADGKNTNKKVSATFWAEQDHTAELFEQHMQLLQQRLQQAGLSVGNLATHHGTPPPADNKPTLPYVLLDLQA